MEPGHPYLTKEFDELRSVQRRRLDTIIGDMASRGMSTDWGTTWKAPDGVSAPVAEAALRDLASRLLGTFDAYLDQAELNQRAEIVGKIISTGDNPGVVGTVGHNFNPWSYIIHPESEDRERQKKLRDAAYLLTAADYFAAGEG